MVCSHSNRRVCVLYNLYYAFFSTRPLNAYNVRVYMNTCASYFDENESCQWWMSVVAIFAECEPEEGKEAWTVVPVRCATPIEFQKLWIEFMECFLFKVNPTFNMRVHFFSYCICRPYIVCLQRIVICSVVVSWFNLNHGSTSIEYYSIESHAPSRTTWFISWKWDLTVSRLARPEKLLEKQHLEK